jgi:hypothetical protein
VDSKVRLNLFGENLRWVVQDPGHALHGTGTIPVNERLGVDSKVR